MTEVAKIMLIITDLGETF